MLPTTVDAVKAILRADPTVSPADRLAIVALVRNHGKAPVQPTPVVPVENRILRRAEVARRLACSLRSVDNLVSDGILHKVTLPGRVRGCGFLLADVERLLVSGHTAEEDGR